MFPRLHVGHLSIGNYSLLCLVGVLVGTAAAWRLAREARLDRRRVIGLLLGTLLAGSMGAHWLFVCTRWGEYQHRPWAVLFFWEGRAFIGGPVLALAFVLGYTRRFRLPAWKVMDVLAPGLAIGHMFGRFGCCAAGCCHGRPTGCCLGVRFFSTSVEPCAWRGLSLHPTQLYEAAGLLALFYGLLWLWRRRSFDGQVGLAYLLAYPVLRFVVEFFRGDARRGFVIPGVLSTSQFVVLVLFAGALLALVLRLRTVRARGVEIPAILRVGPSVSAADQRTTGRKAA